MNSSLIYLTRTKLKNQIKQFFRSPGKIVYLVFWIAIIVITSLDGDKDTLLFSEGYRSMNELAIFVMALYTLMFVLIFFSGYSNGSTVFSMGDVNLLFPSPLSPHKILFYGLFNQIGSSLLLGIFLLFQHGWLSSIYGISYPQLLAILVGYSLVVFLSQITAIALYCRTSSNDRQQSLVKTAISLLCLALLLPAFIKVSPLILDRNFGEILPALTDYIGYLPVKLFPVSGWATFLIFGGINGQMPAMLLFGLIVLAYFALIVLSITRSKHNYYEDVLFATEVSQSAITANKEGNVGEAVGKKVKLGKIGIGKGQGASVIYHKHVLENRRAGLLGISNLSLIFVVIIVVFAAFVRDEGIIPVFAMSFYLQIFSSSLGRFSRELTKPYIFLLPDSSIKKLYYSIKESMREASIESILIFVPAGLLTSSPIQDIIMCIVTRICLSLFFTGANIVVHRFFGRTKSRFFILLFYFALLILMLIPAAALAMLAVTFLSGLISEIVTALIGISIGCLLSSFVVMYICRNVLQYSDYNN